MFNFVCGVATLAASLLAGALWQWWGPTATFIAAAAVALAAFASTILWRIRMA